MPLTKDELASLVLQHLLDINSDRCSITEGSILEEQDEALQSILVGILTLHEDLRYREAERAEAAEQLRLLNVDLERRVREQTRAILALSTPVLQVWDGILVLPLVGTVDTGRAQQITRGLLEAIVADEATTAIIDITGIPLVDTTVANHFLKTIEAARLLGAEVILCGVGPYNAQALVKLGVDLGAVSTASTLRVALQTALLRKNGRAGSARREGPAREERIR